MTPATTPSTREPLGGPARVVEHVLRSVAR